MVTRKMHVLCSSESKARSQRRIPWGLKERGRRAGVRVACAPKVKGKNRNYVKLSMERSMSRDKKGGEVKPEVEEERKTITIQDGAAVPTRTTSSSKKILFRKVVRRLANLKFAIGEIAFLALLSALGTIVEQNRAPVFYTSQLVEGNPVLSDILGNLVLLFGFDHMYTSPFYLALCALLTSSLMACSYQTQWPMVRVAQRWRFIEEPQKVLKLASSHSLRARPTTSNKGERPMREVSSVLSSKGYEIFVKRKEDGSGEALYAFKGLAGKFAPIGVHISMVLVVLGASISSTCGWHGTLMIDEGSEMPVREALAPNSLLARLSGQPWKSPDTDSDINLQLNKFRIDYYPDGKVEQFYSDLSVTEGVTSSQPGASSSQEVFKKLISVNNPLRFGALTAYQTDWAISGIQVKVVVGGGEAVQGASEEDGQQAGAAASERESNSFNIGIPMVSLEGRLGDIGGRIWGGVVPVFVDNGEGENGGLVQVTFVARDLQSVAVYDEGGQFKGILRPGSKRLLDVGGGVSVNVLSLGSSSGLELKSDPGVPVVYTGFAFLMLTTVLSYVSHSQVWAFAATNQNNDDEGEEEAKLVIGGTTNRAKREFQNELAGIVQEVNHQLSR